MDVAFKAPVPLPARVRFHAVETKGGGWAFLLAGGRDGTRTHPHGSVTPSEE